MTLIKKKGSTNFKYKQYVQSSVQKNTRQNLIDIKGKDKDYEQLIRKHLANFDNTNQTIIGSELFTLFFQAKNQPETYIKTRIPTLKKLYEFININHSWYDLWKTVETIESNLSQKKEIVDKHIMKEIRDMFRLYLPHPKWVVGIEDNGEPILQKPVFFVTDSLIDMLHSNKPAGRKKSKALGTIQFLTPVFYTYHIYTYGLYNQGILDLLANNGLSEYMIPTMELPRQIATSTQLANFISENRQYTMNPNGVVIDCYNCGDIDQLIMVEKNDYVLWKIIFKKDGVTLNHKAELISVNGAEYCGYLNFGTNRPARSLFTDNNPYPKFEFDIYNFVLECYADIVCGSSLLNQNFKRDVINRGAVDMNEDQNHDLESKVGLRFTPRKLYQKIKDAVKSREEYEKEIKKYFVKGHIRRLPEGYSVSKEAKQHAAEFGIDLIEGYTFVRPYENSEEKIRTHYIKTIKL